MNGIAGLMRGRIALLLWLAYPYPPDCLVGRFGALPQLRVEWVILPMSLALAMLCCARFGGAAAAVRVRVQGNGEASSPVVLKILISVAGLPAMLRVPHGRWRGRVLLSLRLCRHHHLF